MSANPYETLGVKHDATQGGIRAAYRRLVKKLHPDLNPGDRNAEEKFKAVSAAYDLLGDPEKRARFDRGEIDAAGAERAAERYYRDFQNVGGHPYETESAFTDIDDLLSGLFGQGVGDARARFRMRGGEDLHFRLSVSFLEAVNGATKRINLPDGSTIDVLIPPGTHDGQALRLRGKGGPGIGGLQGDAIVSIVVRPHPFYTRKGDDIEIELPVTLREAVLGAKLEIPTPAGGVVMSVPKNANTGTRLRLKGRGVLRADRSRGDAYVVLRVMLPERPDPELEAFVQRWQGGRKTNPRRNLEQAA